jgi:hypothetical protein
MQRAQTLTKIFNQLAKLVAKEAEANPAFAAKLDAILARLPQNLAANGKAQSPPVPDVFAEFDSKGKEQFSSWLHSLDLPTLKVIVKANGFDPGKKSSSWKEPDKFVPLIVEQVEARLKRGSAFLTCSEQT